MVRRLIVLAAALIMLATVVTPSAAQPDARATGPTWGTPTLLDPVHGFASIACVTRAVCRAGDLNNRIERWDGVHWTHGTSLPSQPGASIRNMSCTSTVFCAAVQLLPAANGYYDARFRPIVRKTDGSWDVSASAVAIPSPGYGYYYPDLSCATAHFCMLVGFAKYQVWDGSSWSAPKVFGRYGSFPEHVSCASPSSCLAVSQVGDVYRWNGRSWTAPAKLEGANVIRDIDCAAATSCTLLTRQGARRWNGSTWGPLDLFARDTPAEARGLADLSCPTSTFCMAVGFDRYVFRFTSGSGWSGPSRVGSPSAPYDELSQVSCSSAEFCVVVTDDGEAVHWLEGSWQAPRPADLAIGGRPSVSCDSPILCLAVDVGGGAAAFNGTSWTTPRRVADPPPSFVDVSCAGGSFCMAAGAGGQVRIRSHGRWSAGIPVRDEATGDAADRGLTAISCGTSALCLATARPNESTYRWDGSAWHVFTGGYDGDFGASHTAASCGIDGCVAHYFFSGDEGDQSHTFVFHADTGATDELPGAGHSLYKISCTSVSFCMAGDDYFDGQQWVDVPGGGPEFPANPGQRPADLHCATATFCVASEYSYVSTWDGTSWSAAREVIDPSEAPGFLGLSHISCKRTICAASDDYGWVVVATTER